MDEALRVGIVGAGPWARRVHAPGLRSHPDTKLTSVWARRPDTAKELADEHGAEVTDSVDELIDSVDAVAFAVPPSVQAELAPLAARAGKHLILEKPLADTLAAARTLRDTVSDSGVTALLMLTRRFAPEVREWLTDLADTGGWTGGTGRWLASGLLGGDYSASPWRRQRTGALIDAGPHAIDLLDAALGPIEQVHQAHEGADGLWQMMFGHAGGATSTLAVSLRVAAQPAFVDFSVYGSEGHTQLTGRRTAAHECHARLLDEFAAMVRDGRTEHPCDVRRGVHLQEVLTHVQEQADQARTGR